LLRANQGRWWIFPDDPSWQRYRAKGGKLERADWRRENVNGLIAQLYRTVHGVKPWVKFGISPFGLGRPDAGRPASRASANTTNSTRDAELLAPAGLARLLCAAALLARRPEGAGFRHAADYWPGRTPCSATSGPAFFTSAIGDGPKGWTPEDILKQINLIRADPRYTGHIQYSMGRCSRTAMASRKSWRRLLMSMTRWCGPRRGSW